MSPRIAVMLVAAALLVTLVFIETAKDTFASRTGVVLWTLAALTAGAALLHIASW
jgi:hypothetical protein